jgi:hypothetical protein
MHKAIAFLIYVCMATSALTQAQQPEMGMIQGRITIAGSADPLEGVAINMIGIGAVQGKRAQATTDAEGRFAISLDPGRYTITASRSGFTTQRYGNGRLGSPLSVIAGRDSRGLAFHVRRVQMTVANTASIGSRRVNIKLLPESARVQFL